MRPHQRIDHELRAGSAAHYDDPAYYAYAYADRVDDVACYVDLARNYGGPVLEYGCGAGRITIPIARAGIAVTAVDLSRAMIGDLRSRLSKEPIPVRAHVNIRRGDMRSLRVTKRYPLVIAAFNTLLHLYTRNDVERFLARVRAHLRPGGRFIFDTSVPSPVDLARDPAKAFSIPPFRHPTLCVRSKYREYFDYDPIRQVLFVAREFEPKGAPKFMTPLAHRQFFPAELEALLHYNGFQVVDRKGGFGGEPIDRHTDTILWICRASARTPKAAELRRL
ncbi:MAG: class I SAM-dependent methyltransferase [Polyangiales bacterium]